MTGYTADRWAAVWGTTGRTFSRQAGFANSQYCLRVQRNSGSTGTGNSGIATFFETANSIPLQGKTVTLSFNARCGANFSASGSQITAYVYTGTGIDQSASTWYSPGWTGNTQIIGSGVTLTTSSQRFTFTGTIPSNATQIAIYFIGIPTGTAGANDYWEITNVQFEEGAVATPFEFEDYGTTLRKCYRYYQRFIPNTNYGLYGFGTAPNSAAIYANMNYLTPLRTSPSALEYLNISAQDTQNATIAISSMSINQSTTNNCSLLAVVSGATQYRPYAIGSNNTTNSYIGVSAEL